MVRFGIIGTSVIAEKFLSATTGIRGFCLTAVYSRDKKRAEEFGRQYGALCFYDDLTEFAKSDAFDAVYIASPNCFHKEQTVLLLKNGKHVLCEKPIASNVREASAMFDAAHDNNVVLLEAMRSVFAPEFKQIQKYMKKLGTIRRVKFQMNQYSSRYNNYKKGIIENAFRPELSNGALMDLGGYCIYPMVYLFGLPSDVEGMGVFLENGVDASGTTLMKYDHMIGQAEYSKVNNTILPSEIQGEEASMTISGIASPRDITVRYNNGFKEVVHFDQRDNNMEYEIRAFLAMIEGEQSPHFYETASMNTITVMDEVRRKIGIHFPADDLP
ncbi:MAG: Gfo/Idh/MocA family oxidoreductase, partial [Lachnospiraceae bacterium]|nr:Gfo/Idh/MocA family oxidoreductase [Lachnospiraceae bacterium]